MFKEVFKQFKSKRNTTSLPSAYKFNEDEILHGKIRPFSSKPNLCKENLGKLRCFGLNASEEWKIFEVSEKPGLIVIKNPFSNLGQRYWIARCIRDYTKKPNRSNLDPHSELHKNEDWWTLCQESSERSSVLLQKMRWITLGYHHNWDSKVYSEDAKDPFPEDLGQMCKLFANFLGFSNFKSEAAIVNYYHMDSTLSGHTDHSEPNLGAPLFSLSLGQTAVFLVGGLTKEEKPLALFLNSGDVVVMSKECRQCYHAVPCILKAAVTPWTTVEEADNHNDYFLDEFTDKELVSACRKTEFWEPFDQYLLSSRININVRQVLNVGQDNL